MFTITHYKTPPSAAIIRQIVQTTVDNVSDLHMILPQPSNPLYRVYEMTLAMEINQYIISLGPNDVHKAGLVVATDDSVPEKVVGFLLYLAATSVETVCAISYMAVHAGRRRQGIARAMVAEALQRHPQATLTCTVEKVPYYEAMGFKIVGSRHNQVRMNTFGFSTSNVQNVLNVEAFLQHPQVQAAQRTLIQKYGTKALRDAEKQIKRGVERGTTKAESYVRERLGPAGTTPGA